MNDDHPADGLAKAFQGLFDGTNIKQALRDAWDRHFGTAAPAEPSDTVKAMNQAENDKSVQDANKSFLTPAAAASVRAKASKSMGGK